MKTSYLKNQVQLIFPIFLDSFDKAESISGEFNRKYVKRVSSLYNDYWETICSCSGTDTEANAFDYIPIREKIIELINRCPDKALRKSILFEDIIRKFDFGR